MKLESEGFFEATLKTWYGYMGEDSEEWTPS